MTAAVPIMCFDAGGVGFAVAVADVVWLGERNPWAPPLARALGLAPRDDARDFTLTLAAARGLVHVRVEGPVVVRSLAPAQIVRAPNGLPLGPAVIGFARVDDRLLQLLDVEVVVARLPGPRDREDPRAVIQ